MSEKPIRKPKQRCIVKGDYPAPTDPLYNYLSPYKRRSLPWRFIPADDWQNALTLLSGDSAYDAAVWMDGESVRVEVRRLYVDRLGRPVYNGHADGVAGIPSRAERERVAQLFREYPREWLSALAHQHWGAHNAFCLPDCTLYSHVGRVDIGEADPKEPFTYLGDYDRY